MPARTLGFVLLSFLVGCGGGDAPPATTKVSGRVTFKGEPLMKGTVTFHRKNAAGEVARPATGPIKEDGTYTLGTFTAGDGVMPGEYAVTIVSLGDPPSDEDFGKGAKQESLIPEKYGKIESSGFTVTVGDEALTKDFELEE